MVASDSSIGLFGYLAFVELAAHGVVGGYLLVNQHARPLEFHCTAPVCPSRTHEILYGPTLHSVLCAEQIGPSLVEQSRLQPELFLTDEPAALALRARVSAPVALVTDEHSANATDVWSLEVRNRTLSCNATEDQPAIEELLSHVPGEWDLAEPLERIRAAIHEAQRAAA